VIKSSAFSALILPVLQVRVSKLDRHIEIVLILFLCLFKSQFNTLNAELNYICHLLALLGAHHILHVRRMRVKHMLVQDCQTGYGHLFAHAFKHTIRSNSIFDAI
jgi:hypothetical protein